MTPPPTGSLGLGCIVLQPFCSDPHSPHLALGLLCIPAALSDFPSALSAAQKPASRNSILGSLACGHQLLSGPFCRVLGGGSRPLSWISSVSCLSHSSASGRGALREGEHRLSPPPSMSPLPGLVGPWRLCICGPRVCWVLGGSSGGRQGGPGEQPSGKGQPGRHGFWLSGQWAV